MKKIVQATLLVLAFSFILISAAQAQTQQQSLNQYVADLQKNSNNYALREKIIRHVQAMKPKPAIPEEAERRMARGSAAVKGAQNKQDFLDAAAEFEKASLAAPWMPAVYYNLGITQDKAGKYKEAIQNLKLYLVAAPDASDAKAVKNLTYEIEYRQEKAANAPPPQVQTTAASKQNTFEDLLRKIDGRRYWRQDHVNRSVWSIEVRGGVLRWGVTDPDSSRFSERGRFEIQGRESTYGLPGRPGEVATFIISQDGDSITQHIVRKSDGASGTFTYIWER